MAKAAPDVLNALEDLLNSAAARLPDTSSKKMFGCHAIWVNDNVFALVWKHGRIGVKLPDEGSYESLMTIQGSEPWKAGPMKMAHWVLVPESFHSKPAELKKWATRAHALCSKLEKKAKRPASSKKAAAPKTKPKAKARAKKAK